MENEGKCPVMHGAMTSNSSSGTSNKDWWPDQLNLIFCISMTENLIQWMRVLTIEKNLKISTMML